ncbi:MAG: hypothetical protein ACK4MD_06600 [Demequina sp.]
MGPDYAGLPAWAAEPLEARTTSSGWNTTCSRAVSCARPAGKAVALGRALGAIEGTLESLCDLIRHAFSPRTYEPTGA